MAGEGTPIQESSGSSSQLLSNRKRLHPEEGKEEGGRQKCQRVDSADGVPGEMEGPQQPSGTDSFPTSLPHSIAPYQQPREVEREFETEMEQGDTHSHARSNKDQQPSSATQQSANIPNPQIHPMPSRLASIIQGYWYVRARKEVVRKSRLT